MNDEIIPLEDDIYEEEIEVEEETAVMNAMWGNISGNIENQTDLQQALDAKQDNLTQAQLDAVNSGITSDKVATYDGYPAQITSAVSSEADIRRQADTTLQSNIDAEERARKAADKDIQDVVDGETLARQNADNALGGRIDTEIHDRQVADNGLQSQIDAITSKSDVVDVVANYAALQAYDTSTLGNNDVVKVLDDETHGDAMTYYRWSTTTQTWTYIGQEAPYYTKSQTDTLLLDKQDKIDATHKLSADLVDDTSTTNKFVTAQDKTNWNAKQDALTAGNNIDITGTTISTPAIAPEVVAELPATGAEGKLYLTPKAHTTQTATGNPITATVAEDAGAIESFQLDGDTEQQSYTGKNLCNQATFVKGRLDNGVLGYASNTTSLTVEGNSITYTTNANYRGIVSAYIPVEPNTEYTLSRTVTSEITVSALIDVFESDSEASWITRLLTATFTTPSNCHYLRISFQNYASGTATISNIQVEKSSSATSFEPYVGGVPSPNPDYPQPIQTVTGEQTVEIHGKNWFDYTIWETAGKTVLRANAVDIENPTGNTLKLTNKIKQVNNFAAMEIANSKLLLGKTATISAKFKNSTVPNTKIALYWGTANTVGNQIVGQDYFGESGFAQVTANIPAAFPIGADRIRVVIYANGGASGNIGEVGESVEWSDIQLEVGSTPTAYAPYHATSYPLNLGKNLYNKATDSLGYYLDSNGDSVANGDSWRISEYVSVQPGGQYTFSGLAFTPNAPRFCYYDSSKRFVSDITRPTGKHTITIPAGVYYIRFSIYDYVPGSSTSNPSHEASSFQFEAGSTATTYAPYVTPIELCKLGTYQDYIWKDGEEWKLHKEIGHDKKIVSLAGIDGYSSVYGTATTSNGAFAIISTNWGSDYATTAGLAIASSVIGVYQSQNIDSNNTANSMTDGTFCQRSGTNDRVYFRFASWARSKTVNEVNQMITDNGGIDLWYPLTTPTDTAITDSTLITQLEAIRTASLENGTNTITNTATGSNLAGDMEIGYYGYNPTNRYDKWLWLDLNNNYEQIGS